MGFVLGVKGTDYAEDGYNDPDHVLTTSEQQVLSWYIGDAGGMTLQYDGTGLTKLLDAQIGTTERYYELWLTQARFTVTNGAVNYSSSPSSGWFCSYALSGIRDVSTVSTPVSGSTGYVTAFSVTVTGLQAGWLAVSGARRGGGATPPTVTVGGQNALDYGLGIGGTRAGGLAHWISTGTSVQFDWAGPNDTYQYWGAGIPPGGGGNKMILAMSRAQRFYQDLKRGLIPPQDLRRRYQQAWAI